MYAGPKPRPYHWTFRVAADDADQAKERAINEFHAMARLSSVGWTREIVLVELESISAA